jgi:hypothetical protein
VKQLSYIICRPVPGPRSAIIDCAFIVSHASHLLLDPFWSCAWCWLLFSQHPPLSNSVYFSRCSLNSVLESVLTVNYSYRVCTAGGQPDMLLSDIVTATTGAGGHKLTFLRNMVAENVGNLRTCAQVWSDRGGSASHTLGQTI